MKVRGKTTTVKAGVLFLLADTLAAHSIGGFKVGVGFALRKCRMCLATQTQAAAKVCSKVYVYVLLRFSNLLTIV